MNSRRHSRVLKLNAGLVLQKAEGIVFSLLLLTSLVFYVLYCLVVIISVAR